jgi:hypothetical protein
MQFRVPRQLKAEFLEWCRGEGITPSFAIKAYMDSMVLKKSGVACSASSFVAVKKLDKALEIKPKVDALEEAKEFVKNLPKGDPKGTYMERHEASQQEWLAKRMRKRSDG